MDLKGIRFSSYRPNFERIRIMLSWKKASPFVWRFGGYFASELVYSLLLLSNQVWKVQNIFHLRKSVSAWYLKHIFGEIDVLRELCKVNITSPFFRQVVSFICRPSNESRVWISVLTTWEDVFIISHQISFPAEKKLYQNFSHRISYSWCFDWRRFFFRISFEDQFLTCATTQISALYNLAFFQMFAASKIYLLTINILISKYVVGFNKQGRNFIYTEAVLLYFHRLESKEMSNE